MQCEHSRKNSMKSRIPANSVMLYLANCSHQKLKRKSRSNDLNSASYRNSELSIMEFEQNNVSFRVEVEEGMCGISSRFTERKEASFVSYTSFEIKSVKNEKYYPNENTTDFESMISNEKVNFSNNAANINQAFSQKLNEYQDLMSKSSNSEGSERHKNINTEMLESLLLHLPICKESRYHKRTDQMKRRKKYLDIAEADCIEPNVPLNNDTLEKSAYIQMNVKLAPEYECLGAQREISQLHEEPENICNNSNIFLPSFRRGHIKNMIALHSTQPISLDIPYNNKSTSRSIISKSEEKPLEDEGRELNNYYSEETKLNLSDLDASKNFSEILSPKGTKRNQAIIQRNKLLNSSIGFFNPKNRLQFKKSLKSNITSSYQMALGGGADSPSRRRSSLDLEKIVETQSILDVGKGFSSQSSLELPKLKYRSYENLRLEYQENLSLDSDDVRSLLSF